MKRQDNEKAMPKVKRALWQVHVSVDDNPLADRFFRQVRSVAAYQHVRIEDIIANLAQLPCVIEFFEDHK